jgi:TP901 family phage tail tape measure protein
MAANELKVLLTGDGSRLSASLNTASSRLKSFGNNVKSVGSSLQRFSLPLALAGGAAVKMGVDFDKSMTQIKSLVGVAGAEVDKMGAAAREMAVNTGKSSTEAADALFFITSAGLRGSEAMDVLNASLQAAAVGLGETKTVADLATSAMNAYGSNVLSATDATDVMVAAVREGKLEATELAASMGRVLPIASAMGVNFNEVGAAFAALSRTGTNAAEAATQVRGIFSSLLKPTTDAENALKEMGLSSAGLRKSLKEDGLLATLEVLKSNFEGNDTAAQRVFGNVRALSGVMDLLGANVDTTRQIFDNMNKTQGTTAKAFNETAKSASFQLTAAINKAKESFAQMGAIMLKTMLPLFQDIAAAIGKIFNAFNNLEPTTQKLALGFGALVVALPTIITLVGTLTTIVGALLSPLGLVAAALAAVAYVIYQNWGEVAPVVVGLYNQFVDLYNSSEALRVVIGVLGATFKSVFIGVKAVVDGFVNTFTTMWNVIKEFSEKGVKGAFGDILQEGFENGKQITEKAGEDIGNAYSDAIAGAVKDRLEKKTVEQLNAGLTNIGNKAKGLISGIFSGGGGVGQSVQAPTQQQPTDLGKTFQSNGVQGDQLISGSAQSPLTGVVEQMNIDLEGMAAAQEKYEANLQRLQEIGAAVGQSVAGAFSDMTGSMIDSLGLADSGMQGFLKGLLKTVVQLISMMLASSISQAIAGATAAGTATGPAAIFTTPAFIATAVGGVMAAFAAIPKFADGGIVSGPTMGLMGEYPGAKSNPEVIAPLSKLQNLMGGNGGNGGNMNVSGEFVVRGQDLVVALQRADKTRSRIK